MSSNRNNKSTSKKAESTKKEAQYRSDRTLEDQLRHIHAFMFLLASKNSNDIKIIATALEKKYKDIQAKNNSDAACHDFYELLNTYLPKDGSDKVNAPGFTSSPTKLFRYTDQYSISSTKKTVTPALGEMTSSGKMMYNADLVIGLKFSVPKLTFAYRLDYDGPSQKGLHLNMDFILNNSKYSFTLSHILPEDNGRFSIVKQVYPVEQQDLVKFKFFFKMTLSCILGKYHPTENKDNVFLNYCLEYGHTLEELDREYLNLPNRPLLINFLVERYTASRKDSKIKRFSILSDIANANVDSDLIDTLTMSPYQATKKK